MFEPNKLDIKIQAPQGKDKKPNKFVKPITFADMVEFIKTLSLSRKVEEEIIKDVKQYPVNAYSHYKSNIRQKVAQVIKKQNSKDE